MSIRGKVANGEGSLYQEPNGRWRATYRVPGDLQRYTVSGRTREEALRRLAERKAEIAATGVPARLERSTTVAALARWWLTTVAQHQVRPSSYGKYSDRVARIESSLGSLAVVELRSEHVATWQAQLLDSGLAAKTVADTRTTLKQVLSEAVAHGLLLTNPVDRVRPPRKERTAARALPSSDIRSLVAAAADHRLGAAVAMLFVQGWRVSEVLGLAWSDIDFDAGTATVRRAAVYVDGRGVVLGPPKTAGVEGVHFLAPTVVELLRKRRRAQAKDRLALGGEWQTQTFHGTPIDLVFTTGDGGLLLRQTVTKVVKDSARRAGLDPLGIATHTGRRSVVTALYAEEGVDLADIARHVGHGSPATTAGYVQSLGNRPQRTAAAAARLLDPSVVQEGIGDTSLGS
ncbi:MAG: site-specific integrase [Acidimicrobiales bacterium]